MFQGKEKEHPTALAASSPLEDGGLARSPDDEKGSGETQVPCLVGQLACKKQIGSLKQFFQNATFVNFICEQPHGT